MANTVKLSADASTIVEWSAALAEALENFPEIGDSLVGLFESGEELFTVYLDSAAAPFADHLVMRFNPGDGLIGLVTAFRARNPDLGIFEHLLPLNNTEQGTSR